MTELSDLIWLIVAGIWVLTRVLPRLFRSRSEKSPATPAGDPAAERPESASPSELPRGPQPSLDPTPSQAQQDPMSRKPRPIEPR